MTFAAWFDEKFGKLISADVVVHEIERCWTIKPKKESDRTIRQNAFFHGPLIDSYVQSFGETDREYTKTYLKTKFCSEVRKNGRGAEYLYVKPTSELTVAEFSRLIDDSIAFLVDNGGALTNSAAAEYRVIK